MSLWECIYFVRERERERDRDRDRDWLWLCAYFLLLTLPKKIVILLLLLFWRIGVGHVLVFMTVISMLAHSCWAIPSQSKMEKCVVFMCVFNDPTRCHTVGIVCSSQPVALVWQLGSSFTKTRCPQLPALIGLCFVWNSLFAVHNNML